MKTKSLIMKELLTDGVMGGIFVIVGIAGLFSPVSLFSVVLVFTMLIAEIIAIILRRKKKFDVWDETAKEHYATARKITLKVVILMLHILTIIFIGLQISIVITAYHLMSLCGAILLIQSISFILLEKRDM